jgi:hypothetical protein
MRLWQPGSSQSHCHRQTLPPLTSRPRFAGWKPRAHHLPSAVLSLPAFVRRSPPDNSCMYPISMSRFLCSDGIVRCTKPFAQARNEANSSRVNGGVDKRCAMLRICPYGCPVQASHAAIFKIVIGDTPAELDLAARCRRSLDETENGAVRQHCAGAGWWPQNFVCGGPSSKGPRLRGRTSARPIDRSVKAAFVSRRNRLCRGVAGAGRRESA